jgi:hypothetical protein
MKMAVLWYHCPDDRGSKHIRNVGKLPPDHMRNNSEESQLHTRLSENLKSVLRHLSEGTVEDNEISSA